MSSFKYHAYVRFLRIYMVRDVYGVDTSKTAEELEAQLANVKYGTDVKYGYNDEELWQLIQTGHPNKDPKYNTGIYNHQLVVFRRDYTATPGDDSERTFKEWKDYDWKLSTNLTYVDHLGPWAAEPNKADDPIFSVKRRKRDIEWDALLKKQVIDPTVFDARKLRRYLGTVQQRPTNATDAQIDALIEAARNSADGIRQLTDEQFIAAVQDGTLATNVCMQPDYSASYCHGDEITDATKRAIIAAFWKSVLAVAVTLVGVDSSKPARPFIPPRQRTDAEVLGMTEAQYQAMPKLMAVRAPSSSQFYSEQHFADNAPRYFIKHGVMHRMH